MNTVSNVSGDAAATFISENKYAFSTGSLTIGSITPGTTWTTGTTGTIGYPVVYPGMLPSTITTSGSSVGFYQTRTPYTTKHIVKRIGSNPKCPSCTTEGTQIVLRYCDGGSTPAQYAREQSSTTAPKNPNAYQTVASSYAVFSGLTCATETEHRPHIHLSCGRCSRPEWILLAADAEENDDNETD